jgi:cytochrome c-type biogenesis protein CcmF
MVGALGFGAERILTMHSGDTVEISGRTVRFAGLHPGRGPNYTEDRARFEILGGGGEVVGTVSSSKRFFPARQTATTEAGIKTIGLSQLYVSLGDEGTDGSVVVRMWWKPLVTLIWLGGLVMMAGGAMALLDRRLRVGAPARRRQKPATAASPS